MKLIIAEKPSLARNIVAGIGKMTRNQGFYSGEGYLVTWAFGHLFSLYDIDDYRGGTPGERRRWTMEGLPCFPEKFRFKLRAGADGTDKGVEKQFETIKALCLRNDVDTVINAGDSDREGEIIIRLCIDNALADKSAKRLCRLWLPDQTPETIREALACMKDESEYDRLADEGYARMFSDWLYGVNLTRYATLKTGSFLRCGRVIIPIVKAIYDRDEAIKKFTPEIYYSAVSKADDKCAFELVSKQRFSKDEYKKAGELCDKYNGAETKAVSVKRREETISPGKLYSLSKLQNMLGKKYKMPMNESLELAQKLYESGYITYPRTNSEYLAENEKDKIKTVLNKVAGLGYPVSFRDGAIFDDSKIESHSALTPTHKIPSKDALGEREKLVYSAIIRRFVAVFCDEACKVERTEVVFDCGGFESFTVKGTVMKQRGWTRFDDFSQKDRILPAVSEGDIIKTDFKPVEKQTSPPRHYTIETLNNYLKNPFREEKAIADENTYDTAGASDAEEYRAMFDGIELGTEATRTGIIDNAIKSKYIDLQKDVYTILPGGEYLIKSIEGMKIPLDKKKTVLLGQALKKVFRGEYTVDDSVRLAEEEIKAVFDVKPEAPETDTDTGFFGDKVGICPICGRDVTRGKYGYICSGYKEGCGFKINGTICSRTISASNASLLLGTGRTALIKGFISKSGKTFDAALRLEDGKAVFDFK